jgi:hypothetical protein
MNRHFALRGDDAVKAYLTFPPQCVFDEDDGSILTVHLKNNYLQTAEAILFQLSATNIKPIRLFGHLDAPKAKSSIELFHRIALDIGEEQQVIANVCGEILKLFDQPNHRTYRWEKTSDTQQQYHHPCLSTIVGCTSIAC